MTDRIIRDFGSWKLFEAEEATASQPDPAALYKAGDRKGLMALATATDSEAVKAKPGYQAVINWWTVGHGDLGFWKSLVKSGSAVKADEAQSLKSAFYWGGSGSSEKNLQSFNAFIKAVDAIIANKAKVDAWIQAKGKGSANLSTAWIDELATAKTALMQERDKGFLIKPQGMNYLVPSQYRDNMIDSKPFDSILNSTAPGDSVLGNLARFKPTAKVDAIIANKNNFAASIRLSEADKLAILDGFAQKAQAWADKQNKKKPGSETVESAISKATSLYLAPQNVAITTTQAAATEGPTTVTATFSYPANPKGDETSEAFKKGLQMFPDDGTTIGETALAELKAAVKDAADKVKAAGGTITGVKTYAYSSTSQVPTKYGSTDATWKAENNVKLANDRLAAINGALGAALAEAGITVKPTVDAANNTAKPNQGPAWGDAQRRDPKYGKPGARTQEYQDEYGKWRFAAGFFELTYTVTRTEPTQTAPTSAPSGTWKWVISWGDESISIEIPSISFGSTYSSGSKPKMKSSSTTACPVF